MLLLLNYFPSSRNKIENEIEFIKNIALDQAKRKGLHRILAYNKQWNENIKVEQAWEITE